ncbi:MAG TPA: ribonuclease HI [Drouetiella sp.]
MEDNKTNRIVIFTDGACSGNPGPGGWGSIVSLPNGTVQELGGSVPSTTNNRMEIVAALRALQTLEPSEQEQIKLYTDSSYVIKGITQWIWGWRSRGWKSSTGGDVANRDLWEELLRQVMRLKPIEIDWGYVRGHDGNPGNERCDEIAVSFSKNKPERLYAGELDGYFVDLSVLPNQVSVPEQKSGGTSDGGSRSSAKSSSSGGGPVTYLSYVNGVLTKHKTWAECEKLVKGKSGAKFKKVKTQAEEEETLRSWGV